jgi:NAD(P)H-flavin reductase
VLADHLNDVFGLEAYVCGPPAMIDATLQVLEQAGMPTEDIRTDRFSQVKS